MLHYPAASRQKLSLATYRDKVLGCWTGKNIGGTLGGPMEGTREMPDVSFYTQDLKGKPAPNDDLDLQLIWLIAAEKGGVYRLNERVLAEYWLTHVIGPWGEYGVSKANMRNGLLPPLSGACNNDSRKISNGAWIRSEIWACLFPGSPDESATFAYYDACVDHVGDGIYAELFTAALESAAFVINDVRELIKLGLSKIPEDCRIARSVKLACEYYDKGSDYKTARMALVKDSADIGWFQAPANIGFVIIGLLYGEGDFGRSVCIAANCGDDTDCTAGTVGAILGIMKGRSGVPKKWIEPIGESIQTCAISRFPSSPTPVPENLDELTNRVMDLAVRTQAENRNLIALEGNKDIISDDYIARLYGSEIMAKNIWTKNPFELGFDLPYGTLTVDYIGSVEVEPGDIKEFNINVSNVHCIEANITVRILRPADWVSKTPLAESGTFLVKSRYINGIKLAVTVGEFSGSYFYLPLEVSISGRANPIIINIPLQRKNSVDHDINVYDINVYDSNFLADEKHAKSRIAEFKQSSRKTLFNR